MNKDINLKNLRESKEWKQNYQRFLKDKKYSRNQETYNKFIDKVTLTGPVNQKNIMASFKDFRNL